MGWIADRIRNARVYMAIKELSLDLKTASNFRRAQILVGAHKWRIDFLDAVGVPREVSTNPEKFTRDELMAVVSLLEDLIIQGDKILVDSIERFKARGMDGKSLLADNVLQRRALQVWIATIGGMSARRDDVRNIWTLMLEGRNQIINVFDQLDSQDLAMTGLTQPQNMFSKIQITEIYNFFPIGIAD